MKELPKKKNFNLTGSRSDVISDSEEACPPPYFSGTDPTSVSAVEPCHSSVIVLFSVWKKVKGLSRPCRSPSITVVIDRERPRSRGTQRVEDLDLPFFSVEFYMMQSCYILLTQTT